MHKNISDGCAARKKNKYAFCSDSTLSQWPFNPRRPSLAIAPWVYGSLSHVTRPLCACTFSGLRWDLTTIKRGPHLTVLLSSTHDDTTPYPWPPLLELQLSTIDFTISTSSSICGIQRQCATTEEDPLLQISFFGLLPLSLLEVGFGVEGWVSYVAVEWRLSLYLLTPMPTADMRYTGATTFRSLLKAQLRVRPISDLAGEQMWQQATQSTLATWTHVSWEPYWAQVIGS